IEGDDCLAGHFHFSETATDEMKRTAPVDHATDLAIATCAPRGVSFPQPGRASQKEYQPVYETVNPEVALLLPPESLSEPVLAMVFEPETMLMETFCQAELSIGPEVAPNLAEALVNVVLPKLARGNTPPDHGASTIHSAEDRWGF